MKKRQTLKVTVYITTHNYGHYIDQAVQSVLTQTMHDWELLIIDDGSTDNTSEVLEKYHNNPKITIIKQENKGLNVSNNVAIRLSRGQYVMRLDADDYLDENCLLVLSNLLDQKPDVGLVYPDYYHVDAKGEMIEIVRRKKSGAEVELLDLPAHGACTMIRKEVLVNLGSYSEEFSCQDGYDLWIKFIQKYTPYNVNIPLFYYRRHGGNLTSKEKRILDTRQEIKERFIEKNPELSRPVVLGIIPVLSGSLYSQNRPFVELCGKPLVWYTLSEAIKASSLGRIVVATEDDEVIRYVQENFPEVTCFKREGRLSQTDSAAVDLLNEVLNYCQKKDGFKAEAVCSLPISTPLRKSRHIDHAVDTLVIFKADSVISIQEELSPCYHHEKQGLVSINLTSDNAARLERKAIYKGNGALLVSRKNVLLEGKTVGTRVSHITMLPEESIKINTDFEFWLAERIIGEWTVKK